MLSVPACEFLSSLQLGVRDGFQEKVASKLGCGGRTCGFCVQRALLQVEPACPRSEGGVRDGGSRLGSNRSGQERLKW